MESGALSLHGFWQWLSYVPMAHVQGTLLGGGGGHVVNQQAASPALIMYTPSISRPPTLRVKATVKDGHGNMLVLDQLSAGKLRAIASALY